VVVLGVGFVELRGDGGGAGRVTQGHWKEVLHMIQG
jgi:hypothetical protein